MEAEWTTLIDYLKGDSVAGNKLMAAGSFYWVLENSSLDINETVFTALPGGYRENGTFNSIKLYGFWWTTTDENNTNAWSYFLKYKDGHVYRSLKYKSMGLSVRCVKD